MKNPFTYIKASKFFSDYAPNIPSWKKKIWGKNSNGNKIDFSDQEKEVIKEAMKKMFNDFN